MHIKLTFSVILSVFVTRKFFSSIPSSVVFSLLKRFFKPQRSCSFPAEKCTTPHEIPLCVSPDIYRSLFYAAISPLARRSDISTNPQSMPMPSNTFSLSQSFFKLTFPNPQHPHRENINDKPIDKQYLWYIKSSLSLLTEGIRVALLFCRNSTCFSLHNEMAVLCLNWTTKIMC